MALVVSGTGPVNGSTGNDVIDIKKADDGQIEVFYSNISNGKFNPTGRIQVFGRPGDDAITIGPGITQRVEVYGEDGKDTIKGNAGDEILLGGSGDDSIDGGGGRDLIIGNAGADSLVGGAGDDLLIAGSTIFDSAPASLEAIIKEWARTDADYTTRLNHLASGGAGSLNGAILLKPANISNDTSIDRLIGGQGSDAFYADTNGATKDNVTKGKTERLFDI
jgi:Ca2+-binding RTX toxin-like protein